MWTTAEVHADIQRIEEAIEKGYLELDAIAYNATDTKWHYDFLHDIAVLHVKAGVEGRTNAEEREAMARSLVFAAEHFNTEPRPGVIGTQLYEHGMARDLAERTYEMRKMRLRALDSELRVAQTLMATARDVAP